MTLKLKQLVAQYRLWQGVPTEPPIWDSSELTLLRKQDCPSILEMQLCTLNSNTKVYLLPAADLVG